MIDFSMTVLHTIILFIGLICCIYGVSLKVLFVVTKLTIGFLTMMIVGSYGWDLEPSACSDLQIV